MIDHRTRANLLGRARYLQSIACFVKDASIHDRIQREANHLLSTAVSDSMIKPTEIPGELSVNDLDTERIGVV
jgi:hypothetical protein